MCIDCDCSVNTPSVACTHEPILLHSNSLLVFRLFSCRVDDGTLCTLSRLAPSIFTHSRCGLLRSFNTWCRNYFELAIDSIVSCLPACLLPACPQGDRVQRYGTKQHAFHLTLVRTGHSTCLSSQACEHNVSQRDRAAATVPSASQHL